jgi:hypothetical protein
VFTARYELNHTLRIKLSLMAEGQQKATVIQGVNFVSHPERAQLLLRTLTVAHRAQFITTDKQSISRPEPDKSNTHTLLLDNTFSRSSFTLKCAFWSPAHDCICTYQCSWHTAKRNISLLRAWVMKERNAWQDACLNSFPLQGENRTLLTGAHVKPADVNLLTSVLILQFHGLKMTPWGSKHVAR